MQRAIERFEECEEKDAHYCGALALLAQGHYEQGELEKAISAYKMCIRDRCKGRKKAACDSEKFKGVF